MQDKRGRAKGQQFATSHRIQPVVFTQRMEARYRRFGASLSRSAGRAKPAQKFKKR
ncbi:MAG TPA: hypothetical protein VFF31_08620 [Blastocatellia bacterium]|jgi:hypothetical protein|nr:hypothetical protein [Blastocatellia bacterium]